MNNIFEIFFNKLIIFLKEMKHLRNHITYLSFLNYFFIFWLFYLSLSLLISFIFSDSFISSFIIFQFECLIIIIRQFYNSKFVLLFYIVYLCVCFCLEFVLVFFFFWMH